MKAVDLFLAVSLLSVFSGHVTCSDSPFWISRETHQQALKHGLRLATLGLRGLIWEWESPGGWLVHDKCPARKLFSAETIDSVESCLSETTEDMFVIPDPWKTCKTHGYGDKSPKTGSEWLDRLCEEGNHSGHVNFVTCLIMMSRQPYEEMHNRTVAQDSLTRLANCLNDVATGWLHKLITFYKKVTPEHLKQKSATHEATSRAAAEAVTWLVDFFTLEDQEAEQQKDEL